MKTDFKVYQRKIDIYRKANAIDPRLWTYVWSTNAYRTCKDALAATQALHPNETFKASFSKA